MLPATTYPGMPRCPECTSDKTTKESADRYEVPPNGYATEAEAIADWNSIAPEHRTQERLSKMIAAVRL